MIKIGTAPDSWGVWYPEDNEQVPWERYLDEASLAGYRFSELGPFGYMPQETEVLRDALEQRGIAITAGTFVGRLSDPQGRERIIQSLASMSSFVEALDGDYVVIMDDGDAYSIPESRQIAAGPWKSMMGFVDELVKMGRDLGVRVLFHPHLDTCVESADEILRFLEDTDCNLCFDTGHHACTGADPLEFIEKYSGRIEYLHVKNINSAVRERVLANKLSLVEGIAGGLMSELRDGALDFRAIRDSLREVRYSGYAVVEQDIRPAPPGRALEAAKSNLVFLEEINFAGGGS